MKVTILKEGVSTEVKGSTVYAKVGETIEVSKEAGDFLIKHNWAKSNEKKSKETLND